MGDDSDIADIQATGLLDGVDGLDADARARRAELIEWLLGRGFSVAEIHEAVSPVLLAARRLVGDDGTYVSAREISETFGVDLELLERMQRAFGLPRVEDPDAAVHMRADAETAAHTQRFVEMGLDPDQVVFIAGVLSDGLSRAAEVMRTSVLSAVLRPDATELEAAKDAEALVQQILPTLGPMIKDMLFVQLRHAMETEAVAATERADGASLRGAQPISVAFADLVGFTRLGEAVPPEELEQLAFRLEVLAREVAVPPVRFIKTIGDAVMLVSPEPAPLVVALLDLIDATGADQDFPRLRAGTASGMAVTRAGDWYGSPVNLASRVTGVARPGSVLVTEPVREAIGDDGFRWSSAGARRLKGIKGDVRLYRARRDE